jgi:hypothetical protein
MLRRADCFCREETGKGNKVMAGRPAWAITKGKHPEAQAGPSGRQSSKSPIGAAPKKPTNEVINYSRQSAITHS